MTNENFDFEEWFDFLHEYSLRQGVKCNFPEEWREDYDDGLTPEEAYRNAWS